MKIFCVDAKVNRRNDRWIAKDPNEVQVIRKTEYPASIYILGVVSSERDVLPPHYFQRGKKPDQEGVPDGPQGGEIMWLQDGAPAHTRSKCKENFEISGSRTCGLLAVQIRIPCITTHDMSLRIQQTCPQQH